MKNSDKDKDIKELFFLLQMHKLQCTNLLKDRVMVILFFLC